MTSDKVGLTLFLIAIAAVYALPTIVAFRRGHPNRYVILVVNLAFGGTIIGWGIALAWALHAVHRPEDARSGGESGLNLFINDPKKVQLVEPPPLPSSMGQELERLHRLLAEGALTQAEFDGLKAKLIGGQP